MFADPGPTSPSWPLDATRDLLPHCAVDKPLLRESTAILAHSTLSFKGLLEEISTEEGREAIGSVIEEGEANRLVSFWTHEFVLA